MTMSETEVQIPVFCGDCNVTGSVGRVTASMTCHSCGSTNLGLLGVDPRPSVVVAQRRQAAPHGPGTGWTGPDQRRYDGLNEYAGPTPQVTPRSAPVADTTVCPVCHGSKYDLIDKGPCRECGGTGYITHPTQRGPAQNYDPGRVAPPGSAQLAATGGLTREAHARIAGRPSTDPFGSPEEHVRHSTPNYPGNDPSTFTERSPNLKTREDRNYDAPTGPYQMDQANCPNCGHSPTQLVKDKDEDAWWHCPNCGPLANIDANPEINPYGPPQGFSPDRNMRTGGFLRRNRKTGRMLSMLAMIHERNELDCQEAVELARKTMIAYREGR